MQNALFSLLSLEEIQRNNALIDSSQDKHFSEKTSEELEANLAIHPSYAKYKEESLSLLEKYQEDPEHPSWEDTSPSGNYFIRIIPLSPKQGKCWGISKAEVYRKSQSGTPELVATVVRSYSWRDHSWFSKGGKEYLLYSENYNGGVNVMDLDTGEYSEYIRPGGGLCTLKTAVSPNVNWAVFQGCIWGDRAEIRVYRIPENPMILPWKESRYLNPYYRKLMEDIGDHTVEVGWEPDDPEEDDKRHETFTLRLNFEMCYLDGDLERELYEEACRENEEAKARNGKA